MDMFWLAITALTVIPLYKLLPHFGIDKRWAFAAIIPLGAVALLWYMTQKLTELEKL